MEEIVKSLAIDIKQFQQDTRASIQKLEKQIGQLATSVSRLESQGKLPSQIVTNPTANKVNKHDLKVELEKEAVEPK